MPRKLTYILLLSLLLLSLQLLAIAQETPEYRCAACGKPIVKQAVVIEGKLYHPECFRCALCDQPIRDEYRRDKEGRYYHKSCFERLHHTRCALCGEPITEGDYTVYENRIYHQSCYLKKIAPRCDICGELLAESFITDYWGNRFHPRHADEFPVCNICGRLVWRDGVQLDEKRWLCAVCAEQSVASPERGRAILEEVREELAGIGIVVKTLRLSIELSGADHLNAGRVTRGHSHAYAHVNWNPGQVSMGDETATIEVLSGLPEDMLRGIIAHELMHVWQHENNADDLPPDLREGSANWASSLIYSRMHTPRGQFFLDGLEKSRDPLYGAGYRRMMKFADREGVKETLKMLKEEGAKKEENP